MVWIAAELLEPPSEPFHLGPGIRRDERTYRSSKRYPPQRGLPCQPLEKAGDTRTVDVHVRQVRRKLGDASPIVTVWGVGYKVSSERTPAPAA